MESYELTPAVKAMIDTFPEDVVPVRVDHEGEISIVPVSRRFFIDFLAADVVQYAERLVALGNAGEAAA